MLVQTPRSGYAPSLACERCRTAARCDRCTGPLPARRCGGSAVLRMVRRPRSRAGPAASAATAACGPRWWESPAPPRSSAAPSQASRSAPPAAASVRAGVPSTPAIVVATPGAEPVAEAGYAAVVLLDTWLPLGRADLRAEEETLRRWLNAAGLARPGGRVVAVGEPDQPALQALVRWDPAGFAERETVQRAEAHLPPSSRLATITGDPGAVDDAITLLDLPDGAEVLGPVVPPASSLASSSGCRASRAPLCRARWARSSASAPHASSTPYGSRSTRPTSLNVRTTAAGTSGSPAAGTPA